MKWLDMKLYNGTKDERIKQEMADIGYKVFFIFFNLLLISMLVKIIFFNTSGIVFIYFDLIIICISSGVLNFLMWKRGIGIFSKNNTIKSTIIKSISIGFFWLSLMIIIDYFLSSKIPNLKSIFRYIVGGLIFGFGFTYIMGKITKINNRRGDQLAEVD